jgi:cytochrome c oxidase subunit 2
VLLSGVLHLSFWCLEISYYYFQNANGPSAEALLCFSDLTLLLIMPIGFCVASLLFCIVLELPLFRSLLEHQPLEFVWTVLPGLALLFLALPSLSLLYLLDEVGLPASTTKVVGHQWYWSNEYFDFDALAISSYLSPCPARLLGADASLVLRSQIVLRLLITGADVLHSWTIPAFGLKVDAVPGRLNQLSTFLERTGVYYGQCSEICGSNHSFMPIQAEVLP